MSPSLIIKNKTNAPRYACRLDAQLDELHQHSADKLVQLHHDGADTSTSQQINHLQDIIHSLSTASKSQPLLRLENLLNLLSRSSFPRDEPAVTAETNSNAAYITELRWLIAAKAVVQVLGSVLRIYLDRSLVLSEEIAYWDEVRSSVWFSGLYTLQTTPSWMWGELQGRYRDSRGSLGLVVSTHWTRLYDRMRRCGLSMSAVGLRRTVSSVLLARRADMRLKRKDLVDLKARYTSCIGFLVQECLPGGAHGLEGCDTSEQWRDIVLKSAMVMEKIILTTGDTTSGFEETVATIEREGQAGNYPRKDPGLVIDRLVDILRNRLPNSLTLAKASIDSHGRPSYVTRYWLPFAFGFFTANTFMKIWASQGAQIISWIMDIGSTSVRFWRNWVVEPIEKLVKTIRHDEGSEIALMSKNSLEADRASLERMVVDFVIDRDASAGQGTAGETDILANKVREGDLTPVLKAYERDLRTPFVGTVRGDLIRALLIQIQKTKVDVEVAISGIDSLLKSQELVFGWAC